MRKLHLLLSACTILFSFNACSNEEIPQVSQKEQNLLILQSIAKEVGVNVEIKLSDNFNLPLSEEQIKVHRHIFQ